MKHIITTLTIILGIATAETMLAYPTTGNANGDQANNSQTSNRQMEKVKLSELPQSVQTGINQHAAGGDIKHISRVTENGQTFYEVSLKTSAGDKQMFKVDSNGQYLGPQTKDMNQIGTENNSATPQSGGVRPSQQEK